jgi:hypothetical protein
MESFGIPEADSAYTALTDTVRANNQQLQTVAMALAQPLAQQITDNETGFAKVKGSLGRSLSSRVRNNAKQLDTVGLALAQNIVSTAANAATQLAAANVSPVAPAVAPAAPGNDGLLPGECFAPDGKLGSCGPAGVPTVDDGSSYWLVNTPTAVFYEVVPPGVVPKWPAGWSVLKGPIPWAAFSRWPGPCTCGLPMYGYDVGIGNGGGGNGGGQPEKFWCGEDPTDHNWYWGSTITQPMPGNFILHGMYDTAAAAQAGCVKPPPLTKWFCLINTETNETQVSQTQLPLPWIVSSGPYNTQDEANAQCAQAPPPLQQWGCYRSDIDGSYKVYLWGNPLPGDSVISGPYNSQEEASASCIQPLPPGETQPECSVLKLPSLDFTGQALLHVGSPQWCTDIEPVMRMMSQIGDAILKWAVDNLDPEYLVGALEPEPGIGLISPIWDAVSKMIVRIKNWLKCLTKSALSGIRDILKYTYQVGPLLLGEQWSVYGGVNTIRLFVRSLEKIRLGTDAGVWLTGDFSIEFKELLKILDYLANWSIQQEIPHAPDAIEAYLKGTITEDYLKCLLALNGCFWDTWKPIIDARRERLHAKELIEYGRRNDWPDAVILDQLKKLGFINPDESQAVLDLYWEIPSISDHLHWLQRNVFDDEYVRDYQLLDGFKDRFWSKFGKQLEIKGMKEEYAALHYAAHWINPAPSQLLEMVYRLRPDKPGVQHPFTISDYQRILAEQDVGPFFQPRFAEIANKIPALGYIRDMYHWGVIDDAQLQSYHQDLGYSQDDSINFVKVDKINRARQLASSGHGWTPAALGQAWSVRAITQEFLIDKMLEQGYSGEMAQDTMDRADMEIQRTILMRARSRLLMTTTTQVRNAVKVGVMDAQQAAQTLQSLGWPQSFAVGIAQIDVASANVDRIASTVKTIRGAYLRGEVDKVFAVQSLTQLGIVPTAIQSYIANWSIQQTPNRKRRTASQIVSDVTNGHITVADALSRLDNLGYNDADRMLFMADARAKVAKVEASKAAADLKAGRAKEAELAKLQRLAERQAKQILAALKQQAPVSKLTQWAKLGLITHDTFTSRMRLYGYNDDSIRLQWEAACQAKNAACVEPPTQPKG